jgi:hypothetical protein
MKIVISGHDNCNKEDYIDFYDMYNDMEFIKIFKKKEQQKLLSNYANEYLDDFEDLIVELLNNKFKKYNFEKCNLQENHTYYFLKRDYSFEKKYNFIIKFNRRKTWEKY